MMKKIRKIRQHDQADCGPACLVSVAACHGIRIPLSRVREMASTDTSGTNVLGIIEAAEKMGLTARGVKGPFEALPGAPTPSIAHVVLRDRVCHFVVLVSFGKQHIKYMDPAHGSIVRSSHEAFRRIWTGILIIVSPSASFSRANEDTPVISRFINLARPFRKIIRQAFAGAAVYSLLGLSSSFYVQKIMDFVLVNQNINLLNLMSCSMIILLIIRNLTSYFKNLFLLKTGHQMDCGLMMGYYRHLLTLPQRFFDSMRTGEILSRMNDAVKIRFFINHTIVDLVVSLITILLTLTAMALLSWQLCLLAGLAIPLYGGLYLLYDGLNRSILRRTMEKGADLESQLVDTVRAQRTIRRCNLQDHAYNRTESRFIDLIRVNYRGGLISIRVGEAGDFFAGLLTILILWTGSVRVVQNMMSPGELMSFYAMLGYLMGPVRSLTGMNRTIRDAAIAADRLFQILDLEGEKNQQTGIGISGITHDIRFQQVAFRYGSRPLLFKGLDFSIPRSSVTAIVGKSGCGKSSIAGLLMGIYPPGKGRILVNNCDINQLNKNHLRRVFALVPQQPELLDGTILDNIAPGESEPDTGRILQIAEQTGLTGFLNGLPGGIYTDIGEQGFSLSGGEAQRIAMARALYRRPSILILDEFTSALDAQAEQEMIHLMLYMRDQGMTLIVISHKLQIVSRADHIIMIRDGRVSASGHHGKLYGSAGPYRQFWEQQNGA
jgi:ABC-type bacteriocin/lantibiotic exporter with double-glycine peptidase domain